MASKKDGPNARVEELLQKLLIVQLGLANVPQSQIQKIVGVGMNTVNDVVKLVNKGRASRKGAA